MKKDRYKILKIDSDYFLVIDSEAFGFKTIAHCQSESHASLVAFALNRCNELDKIERVKKL